MITVALPFIAILTRMTRSGLLEVVGEGYITTARAKGLSERVVIFTHATRNATIPVITLVGLEFGTLLGGAVVTETVFSFPGVGRLLVNSILVRDYNVVQACVVVIAVAFVVVNLDRRPPLWLPRPESEAREMTASPQTEAMLTMRRARRSRREVTVRIVVPLVVIGLFVVGAIVVPLLYTSIPCRPSWSTG